MADNEPPLFGAVGDNLEAASCLQRARQIELLAIDLDDDGGGRQPLTNAEGNVETGGAVWESRDRPIRQGQLDRICHEKSLFLVRLERHRIGSGKGSSAQWKQQISPENSPAMGGSSK